MKNKDTSNQDQLLTKKDLFVVVKIIRQYIEKLFLSSLAGQLSTIRKELKQMHLDIMKRLDYIHRSNNFLEREIIMNRLKIKELEERFKKYTLPEKQLSN